MAGLPDLGKELSHLRCSSAHGPRLSASDDALPPSAAERDGAVATSRGLEIRLAALEQRAENAEDTVKRADAARKLADEASQRDADLREDLKRRLENREQQLQAAAAEITRGNAIIERLSEQARAQQQKLRLRADVVKQQERRVADALADPKWIGPKLGAPARRLVRETLADAERAFLGTETTTKARARAQTGRLETFSKLALYRLAPHAPFTVANYVLGLSDEKRLSFKLFLGSTLAGIAPWCFFYAMVGAASGAAAGGAGAAAAAAAAQTTRLVASGADLLVALALAAVLTWQPARAWRAAKAFGEEAKRKSLAA